MYKNFIFFYLLNGQIKSAIAPSAGVNCPPRLYSCPGRGGKDSPSEETNWPTAEVTPPLPSTNWTSETMMLSSNTEPQLVQTAFPLAWSRSISAHPQALHTLGLIAAERDHLYNNTDKGNETVINTIFIVMSCRTWVWLPAEWLWG